jgi:LEA14-like dessication related protein
MGVSMPRTAISSDRLFLIALCTLLLLFVTACATLSGTTEPPNLSIVSIEPLEVTPLEQRYHLMVRLQNPNDHALNVSGMSYVLEVNGQPLLKGVSDNTVNVPSFGESIIELTGISTLFGFVRQIHALQEDKTGKISYKLTGKLSLSNRLGTLPFSYEGTLLPPTASGGGN